MSWADMINGPETDEVVLTLAKLSHADWASDVRLGANTEDVTSDGDLYTASDFQVAMPDQVAERNAEMRWTLFDTTSDVLALLRTTNSVVDIEVSYVLASDPDTVHAGPFDAEIRSVSGEFGMISGQLTIYPVLNELANAVLRFNVIDFPGLK